MIKPIPVVEDFMIEAEPGRGSFLVCPIEGCQRIQVPDSVGEIIEAAENHIERDHIDPPPLGYRRCLNCGELYPDGPGFAIRCPNCAD